MKAMASITQQRDENPRLADNTEHATDCGTSQRGEQQSFLFDHPGSSKTAQGANEQQRREEQHWHNAVGDAARGNPRETV
jgi:hypothetical protein